MILDCTSNTGGSYPSSHTILRDDYITSSAYREGVEGHEPKSRLPPAPLTMETIQCIIFVPGLDTLVEEDDDHKDEIIDDHALIRYDKSLRDAKQA
jgi:hypothetical protein